MSLRRSPSGRVDEVQVNAIEPVLPEDAEGTADKLTPGGRRGQDGRQAAGPEVPSTDGNERLQVGILTFEGV